MTLLTNLLEKKPVIGFIGTVGGIILPYMNAITPYLQFCGLLMGLAIGFLTIREKIKKNKKIKK